MKLINKAREGKLIVGSTLQVQYYRSKNIVLQIFLKQKTKMLKQSQRKAICFGKHEVGWRRGGVGVEGVKFPIPSQLALKTPNGTSAYKRLVCSKITGGRCPIPKFGAEATNGSREQREAVVTPGIAVVDIGCIDSAIDRKKAFPPETRGIHHTYTEQVIRAAPGMLQDPRPWR